MANFSIIAAIFGMCSQIWTPGTFVSIGLNSPRNSFGASGFRSNVSICDGPPLRYTLMIDFFGIGLVVLCSSSARRKPASVSPPNAAAPICRQIPPGKPIAKPRPRAVNGKHGRSLSELIHGILTAELLNMITC